MDSHAARTDLRLISVDDVDYVRSDAKYTLVAWRGETGQPGEAVVRIALKDLVAHFDPAAALATAL